jgi:hypothetical protein
MTALAAPRSNLSNKGPILFSMGYKTKATKVFYNGALTQVGTDGYLIPSVTTAGGVVAGIIDLGNLLSKDTTGLSDGDFVADVKSGVFPFACGTSTDALTIADIGKPVYVLDDQTVGRLPGAGRPIAGVLVKVEGTKFFVAVGLGAGWAGAGATPWAGTAWQGYGSSEDVAAPGALSVNTHITRLTAIDGTDAFTLAAGLWVGQPKAVIVNVAGTNTPIGTVTPSPATTPATVTALGALGDSAEWVWNGSLWVLVSSFGCTFT